MWLCIEYVWMRPCLYLVYFSQVNLDDPKVQAAAKVRLGFTRRTRGTSLNTWSAVKRKHIHSSIVDNI
jgi:hypothetical protein